MDILFAMRVFVRVVERGGISAAARDLGIGQSAVSERIGRLEAHLNTRLLHRNTRSTTLSDVGRLFYERCKIVLEAAAYAESVTSHNADGLRGTLRITAPLALGELVLPELLRPFKAMHPHMVLDLALNDQIVDPVSEGADIAIRLGDAPAASCIDETVGFVECVLVAAPSHLAEHGVPQTLEDLARHPFVRIASTFTEGLLPLKSGRATVQAPIHTAWTVNTWRLQYTLLVEGAGIGVLQWPAAHPALASGQLVRILDSHEVAGFDLRILRPRTRLVPEKTERIFDFLKARMADHPLLYRLK